MKKRGERDGAGRRNRCCILLLAAFLLCPLTARADSMDSMASRGNFGLLYSMEMETGLYAAGAVKLKNCTVELSEDSVVYSGEALKPKVTVKNGSAVLRRGTDYTLSYSDNLEPGTAAVTIRGAGRCTGKVTKTFQIVLGVPEMKSAVSAGYDAVTVTWKPVLGAKKYKLYYKGGTEANWKPAQSGISGTSCTFQSDSLVTGTDYTFTVRAVRGEHESSFDSKGKTVAPVPAQTKITHALTAARGIKLSWEKVEGATGYMIQKKSGSKWKTVKNIKNGSRTTCVDTKVQMGRLYSYRIRAYRKVGEKNVAGIFSPVRIAKWM